MQPVKEITDVETCGLHYLGGYIFHKVHKKFKYSKERAQPEVCQSLAILEAAKSTNDLSYSEKLTDCLDRGGLWKINATAQKVLVETEKIFRNVSCQSCVSTIDKAAILMQALKNVDVQSNFAIICESSACKLDNTVAKDLLTCLLKLFIQVRCFSFAKDVLQKYKLKAKQMKEKALRTNLKQKYSENSKLNEQKLSD